MGMFLNYHNIADNYKPNNLINAFPHRMQTSKLDPTDASKPYEEYNAKGELVGYFWRYGETLNLEFNIDGEITIESNAIILKSIGQTPTSTTIGTIGQRAYNIIDLISWTCVGIIKNEYIWEQDLEFTYPLNGDKSIYLSSEDYLKDKQIELILYNFRMEPIHKQLFNGSPNIIFSIDPELSKTLVKGVYYCSLHVFNDSVYQTIFDSTDCTLLVK